MAKRQYKEKLDSFYSTANAGWMWQGLQHITDYKTTTNTNISPSDSLVTWCEDNILTLNTGKTKEMIVDIRKERRTHQPLFIRYLEVERVSSFKYLEVHISEDLTWTLNTTQLVKNGQQRLYFLRRLRKFGMSPKILSNFYSCVVESV